MKPGGCIDIAELEATIHSDDNSIPEESSLALIMRLYAEALEKMNLPQHPGPAMKAIVEEAGYTDVEVRESTRAVVFDVLAYLYSCSYTCSSNHSPGGLKIRH